MPKLEGCEIFIIVVSTYSIRRSAHPALAETTSGTDNFKREQLCFLPKNIRQSEDQATSMEGFFFDLRALLKYFVKVRFRLYPAFYFLFCNLGFYTFFATATLCNSCAGIFFLFFFFFSEIKWINKRTIRQDGKNIWGRGRTASTRWLDLCSWCPVRLSPKRQSGTPFLWVYHLQERSKGSGAKSFGWQPKAGTLAVQYMVVEASSRDVECHLSDWEGPRSCCARLRRSD